MGKLKKCGVLLALIILTAVAYYLVFKTGRLWQNKNDRLEKHIGVNENSNYSEVSYNSQEVLDEFSECLLGENIDIAGFLVKGSLKAVDLEGNSLEFVCGEGKVLTLFITDSTEYVIINYMDKLPIESTQSSSMNSQHQKITKGGYFSKIHEGEIITANVSEVGNKFIISYLII